MVLLDHQNLTYHAIHLLFNKYNTNTTTVVALASLTELTLSHHTFRISGVLLQLLSIVSEVLKYRPFLFESSSI